MQTLLVLSVALLFLRFNGVLGIAPFGTVFPIPLPIENDDPAFQQCPRESGAYTHTTNCSLFHMCTFGIHAIYSCIDGFFYNPNTGKCQQWSMEQTLDCHQIVKAMSASDVIPLHEPIRDPNNYHRRKSAISPCTQAGIFPDVLDCSLFHYCDTQRRHEIHACPKGLNFDPKIFLCSAPPLVNCQYEPPTLMDDAPDPSTTVNNEVDAICQFYAPATRLPVANRYDRFIVCHENGRSTIEECPTGTLYNALTMLCENKPCTFASNLCHNHGHCIDLPDHEAGFKCLCSSDYTGEYCEEPIAEMDPPETNGGFRSPSDHSHEIKTFPGAMAVEAGQRTTSNDSKGDSQLTFIKTSLTQNPPSSRIWNNVDLSNYYRHRDFNRWVKISYILITVLIALILMASIALSIIMCIRMIWTPSFETVGTWKTLKEDVKV